MGYNKTKIKISFDAEIIETHAYGKDMRVWATCNMEDLLQAIIDENLKNEAIDYLKENQNG